MTPAGEDAARPGSRGAPRRQRNRWLSPELA